MKRLSGKVALITGAAQGIGAAIARLFVAEGARVVINDRRLNKRGEALLAELGSERVIFLRADVTDRDAVADMVTAAHAHFGRVDILVNNAGMNVFHDPLNMPQEAWRRCLSVDLEGVWHCAQAVLPLMLTQGAGSIVNIVSVHGHKIIPGTFPYPVAKHGVIGLTRSLGIEYAARGIRVNSISPGLIMTPAVEAHFALSADPEAERQRQTDLLPCKRIGTPEEVAYTALFLASDEARFINAADIVIDGGRSQLYHE